eukprot:TRINITY_DN42787_c0_g1_i1.p2 TRINITY_DN42787_c0_g1~~TRINITY_DN42787_c0_g1_i1.p2  ORF type:complete len:186 (+),score=37.28 TRINITY_DN42787_c0_g1_i1:42-599(+)
MEKNPWWKNVEGPFLEWKGCIGVKEDGGGCTRAQGKVGKMILHRAVCNRDKEGILRGVDSGENVNEVEGAGSTPLHFAAFEGWLEGVELLLQLGAKVNASNNAGDRPWHWALNMGHQDVAKILEQNGATKERGQVLVQDHVPKVKDFFEKECWQHHPKPHVDFMEWKKREEENLLKERNKLIPGL